MSRRTMMSGIHVYLKNIFFSLFRIFIVFLIIFTLPPFSICKNEIFYDFSSFFLLFIFTFLFRAELVILLDVKLTFDFICE